MEDAKDSAYATAVPRLRFRIRLLVPIAWAIMVSLQLMTVVLVGRPIGVSGWLSVLTTWPLATIAGYLLFEHTVRIVDWDGKRRNISLLAGVILAAAVIGPVDAAKDIALMDWLEPQAHPGLAAMSLAGFVAYGLFFGVLAALYLAWIESARRAADGVALTEAREAETQARLIAARAETAATDARLAALRYQLNPHFLFNTLNAISSMVVTERNRVAEDMLNKLCEFLRATLSSKPEALIPLEDELATIAAYLEIESFRLRDRLTVTFDCPATLNMALVPGFLLQPLVENAIKHGVGATSRPVHLAITASTERGSVLLLRIADDGGPDIDQPHLDDPVAPPKGFGVGLENVSERLCSVFGDRASLVAERCHPGFAATVRLPLNIRREVQAA